MTVSFLRLTPLAALFLAGSALATNGYFPHGYGIRAKGMGGAEVAMSDDAMGGANNPASMAWVGSRLDLGVDLFSPRRDAARSEAGFGTLNGRVDSDRRRFFVPEFGYSRQLGNDLALGLTVYGNGGMNTSYPQGDFNCGGPPANMLCGGGALGVDLMQLIVAPTLAYKLNAQHSVGVSLLLGFQQFEAKGLQAFDNPGGGFPDFTQDPGHVTNRGRDSSHGVGLRLGYLGRLNDMLTVGAAYAPKMSMSRFGRYSGLFAEGGKFDIPAHYALGLAVTPMPALTLALDYERIQYSDVRAVGNASAAMAPLGAADGPGFGWRSIGVVKLGVQWQASPDWTLRAGINRGANPVSAADVSFNIIAPGVTTWHYTGGVTFALNRQDSITGALMLAPRQTVSGPSLFNSVLGENMGGTETIAMRQRSLGLAWGHKF